MTFLKDLSTSEAIEFIHCRLSTIESALCEIMPGFKSDFSEVANKLSPDLTASELSKIIAELDKLKTKYKVGK